jgi:hypothetical protein
MINSGRLGTQVVDEVRRRIQQAAETSQTRIERERVSAPGVSPSLQELVGVCASHPDHGIWACFAFQGGSAGSNPVGATK